MKKPPFIKLYVKDFAFDTQDMSDEELGAYMREFLKSYKSAKISQKNIDETLFLELKKSLDKYSAVCKRNRNNRLNSSGCNNESSTSGQRVVNDPVNQEPLTKNHEPRTINQNQKNINKKPVVPDGFLIFWDQYPRQRRGSKGKAFKAYCNALDRASEDEIYSGVLAYAASREVSEGYAKGCAAWLNDDRWANDYSDVGSCASKKTTLELRDELLSEVENMEDSKCLIKLN